MNWLGLIPIILALILTLISLIVLSTALRNTPGAYGSYGYGNGITTYGGTVSVESGKIVGAIVMEAIALVALIIAVFTVGARQTVTRGLNSLTTINTRT